ncbi:YcxB family protein [Candidatus Berkiella aquae]|uniref:YcxB family protein n=1 Tax=Candidatus Berkiella aquae TaxID=295108 RepID=A0A0Q9YYV2_9GAMM|nr:YcxB family protein [Candidatus Berkiella aquae]MCS5712617.1 YcxB family protein [Candidatus Berkiella aquae]
MEIQVSYQPTAKELMKASSLYVEKKPFFLLIINAMNVFAGIIVILMGIKLYYYGLIPEEWMAGAMGIAWIFGRRPLNEKLLMHRLKDSQILDVPINIVFSLNGIAWSGKGLVTGNMAWGDIRYILEAKNGFLIPNATTRFIWLPFRGFKSAEDILALREAFVQRNIIPRKYLKWEC